MVVQNEYGLNVSEDGFDKIQEDLDGDLDIYLETINQQGDTLYKTLETSTNRGSPERDLHILEQAGVVERKFPGTQYKGQPSYTLSKTAREMLEE